eukprot:11793448-Alexandrium_andersonii.AAC.1
MRRAGQQSVSNSALTASRPSTGTSGRTTRSGRPREPSVRSAGPRPCTMETGPVSYTHLTLPTICSV